MILYLFVFILQCCYVLASLLCHSNTCFQALAKILGYIVEYVLAAIGSKLHGTLYQLIPCALIKSALYISPCYTIFNKAIHQSGIKVVAGTYRTNSMDVLYWIFLFKATVR